MRLGSAGLLALLWSSINGVATASPYADNKNPLPILRPRQTATGAPVTTTTTTPTTTTTTPPAEESTTTVTVTTTVAGGSGGGTTTATTVVLRTVTTTIVVTSTSFQTTTVTSSDVATATVTNYVTSTVLAKRSLNLLPAPVVAPAARITPAGDLRRFGVIEKRALVTVVVTVTGSAAGESTVISTRTSTVLFTTTSNTVTTSLLTSTQYVNAQTTVTVESTLVVTSTAIDTSAPTTVENGPTTGVGTATGTPTDTSGAGSSSGNSDGLSTGAKAGIGAGVGVVGLAVLIGIGYWLYKRRKATRPSRADLDDMRAYDPNGPSPLTGPASMAETGAGFGASAGTMRRQPVPKQPLSPPSQSVSPVSNQNVTPANNYGAAYGRPPAGGAQELGGTRILPAEMGGDELIEMGESQPQPPQQQQRPAPGLGHTSGPVPDVYEMPTERYR